MRISPLVVVSCARATGDTFLHTLANNSVYAKYRSYAEPSSRNSCFPLDASECSCDLIERNMASCRLFGALARYARVNATFVTHAGNYIYASTRERFGKEGMNRIVGRGGDLSAADRFTSRSRSLRDRDRSCFCQRSVVKSSSVYFLLLNWLH